MNEEARVTGELMKLNPTYMQNPGNPSSPYKIERPSEFHEMLSRGLQAGYGEETRVETKPQFNEFNRPTRIFKSGRSGSGGGKNAYRGNSFKYLRFTRSDPWKANPEKQEVPVRNSKQYRRGEMEQELPASPQGERRTGVPSGQEPKNRRLNRLRSLHVFKM